MVMCFVAFSVEATGQRRRSSAGRWRGQEIRTRSWGVEASLLTRQMHLQHPRDVLKTFLRAVIEETYLVVLSLVPNP